MHIPLHSTPGTGGQWGVGVTQAPEPPWHMEVHLLKEILIYVWNLPVPRGRGTELLLSFQVQVIHCPEMKLF